MAFNKGDKVSYLDEPSYGTVVEAGKDYVLVLREDGFEEEVPHQKLILQKKFELNEVVQKDAPAKSSSKKVVIQKDTLEVDLHIHELVDYSKRLSNYEMLQIQLTEAKKVIDKARKAGIKRVVFIHGIGAGKLRNELTELLKGLERLNFFDANYKKYGAGATEVELY